MTAAAGGLRILLVEDEPANRALFRAVVARSTEPVLRTASLEETDTLAGARAALSGGAVDVLILDVRLPDGSGLDLAGELAARRPEDRPKVVIMSASVLPAEREAAIATGCDAFLGKPYAPRELIDVLVDLATSSPATALLGELGEPGGTT